MGYRLRVGFNPTTAPLGKGPYSMTWISRSTAPTARTVCLLTALCLPGTLFASETPDNPLRFYQASDGKSYLQATVGIDVAFFSQDDA